MAVKRDRFGRAVLDSAAYESEFGGKSGLIQKVTDGHVLLEPGEEALLLRRAGLTEKAGQVGGMPVSGADGETDSAGRPLAEPGGAVHPVGSEELSRQEMEDGLTIADLPGVTLPAVPDSEASR